MDILAGEVVAYLPMLSAPTQHRAAASSVDQAWAFAASRRSRLIF